MLHDQGWTRRRLLAFAGTGAVAGAAVRTRADGPETVGTLRRFPRMVHEYYLRHVVDGEREALFRKRALATRADAEAFVQDVRRRIALAFPGMPEARTPLRPRITGRLERDEHVVEKVVFESRPGFLVTANLYLPRRRDGRVPGVVGSCGHSANGKAAVAYQSFAQGLARKGLACLIFDPLGQGERSQYLGVDGTPVFRGPTHEHNVAGNQLALIGEFLGTWRAWDGIRALDYLATRPEVDPRHLGITGNSGGGTLTTWLLALDRRWTMGAPACFVTTWRHNLENELPQDSEQCPPHSLALGLDHDDYLAAAAPRPICIIAQERDYFDVRGAEEAHARLRHLYRLLGAEDAIRLHVGGGTHGFSQENREAMYGFFQLAAGLDVDPSEPALVIEPDEALWCTTTGQVGTAAASRTVFSFTRETAERLREARGRAPRAGIALREAVAADLRLPQEPSAPPRTRIIRAYGPARGYPRRHWIHYAVESEPGIQAICTMLGDEPLHSRLPGPVADGPRRARLWVAERSADTELRDDPWLRAWCETAPAGTPLLACDVRGVGESLPITAGERPDDYYGADYFYAAYGLMLDRPYLGGKTLDVLRVLDMLEAAGWHEIDVAGRGRSCLPAAFAAILRDEVVSLALHDRPASWHAVVTDEHSAWPLSHSLFGPLARWDLPDVWRALEGRLT